MNEYNPPFHIMNEILFFVALISEKIWNPIFEYIPIESQIEKFQNDLGK